MVQCQGTTVHGVRCKSSVATGDFCFWHLPECIACTEKFSIGEPPLQCGHWVHRGCVQSHVNAMQDLRAESGYPPLVEANCPVCKAAVAEIIPKEYDHALFPHARPVAEPEEPDPDVHSITLTFTGMQDSYNLWIDAGGAIPLQGIIWMQLCVEHPTQDPDVLVIAANFFKDIMLENAEQLVNLGERDVVDVPMEGVEEVEG